MNNKSTLDISESSYSTTLGKAITTLWIELQNSISQATFTLSDNKSRFFEGKIKGLRFALPLLKGKGSSLSIASSQIVFRSSYPKKKINQQAKILKTILIRDFEVLNEGGKDGLMKEWLEGHIHAIGLALAIIQPFVSNSAPIQKSSKSLALKTKHVSRIMDRIHSCIPANNSSAKTKSRILSSWAS